MTDRELLKAAVEALKGYRREMNDHQPCDAEKALEAALAEPVQKPVAWVDAVMEQAQVFASAWSLVGGRFDNGSGMEDAEQAKAELRAMLYTAPHRGKS